MLYRCLLAVSLLLHTAIADPTLLETCSCGPSPGPPYLCPDGVNYGGSTGECVRLTDGTCRWQMMACPPPPPPPEEPLQPLPPTPPSPPIISECPRSACGPTLVLPTRLCPDLWTYSGPTNRCLRTDDGSCEWEVISCPDIDDCSSNPCANGGTCIDGANTFTCECASGWAGRTCKQNKNSCAPLNPCRANGDSMALCIDMPAPLDGYNCVCSSRYHNNGNGQCIYGWAPPSGPKGPQLRGADTI